jgi:hypothetical protein
MSGTMPLWRAFSSPLKPNVPPTRYIAPGSEPVPACSITSSASAIPAGATRTSDIRPGLTPWRRSVQPRRRRVRTSYSLLRTLDSEVHPSRVHEIQPDGTADGGRPSAILNRLGRAVFSGDLQLDSVSLGRCGPIVGRHRRHGLKYTVTADERMKQRCCDMQQDQSKKRESKVEMRAPKHRMQAVALR